MEVTKSHPWRCVCGREFLVAYDLHRHMDQCGLLRSLSAERDALASALTTARSQVDTAQSELESMRSDFDQAMKVVYRAQAWLEARRNWEVAIDSDLPAEEHVAFTLAENKAADELLELVDALSPKPTNAT